MKRAPLRRKTPLRPRGRKSAAKYRRKFGLQAQVCRATACVRCCHLAGRPWPADGHSEAHHEPTRARGGTDFDTISLYTPCHRLRHTMAASQFWKGIPWEVYRDRLREAVKQASIAMRRCPEVSPL